MNKCIIIGNLTRDPSMRTVQTGSGPVSVCDMSVAVNRRGTEPPVADYFDVTAWRGLAETCGKYLAKGRKIMASGTIRSRAYQKRDGSAGASLELTAEEIEFLTPRGAAPGDAAEPAGSQAPREEPTPVDDPDDLPF